MGISAFLSVRMAKEKDKIELKPVDEHAERLSRFVRLHKDATEEVVELPPVRVGEKLTPEARLEAATREELKTRSNEPDVGSLIERKLPQPEDQWEGPAAAAKGMPWGWVALIGAIFAGGISWSLVEVNRAEERREELNRQALNILEKEQQEEVDAEDLIGSIEKAAADFFDSRSVEELLRYVRHPERVKPLMENHYAGKPIEPIRVENISGLDPLTIDHRAMFWLVSCELEGSLRNQVLVEAKSATDVKVDWETFVCYQPMPWDEFAKARPGGYTGDFRVYAEMDHYYSYEFSDADEFVSLRLTALNSEETLYGYVERRGVLAKRISDLIANNGENPTPLILRLHVPEGFRSKRGVVVRSLVCPRWMFVTDPEKGGQ